jgi:hypothetical protein
VDVFFTPRDSVIYTDADGKEFRYSGGVLSWRMNNPGDLWSGPVSKRNGEIGRYGHFAVFPDYDTGHAALLDSLSTTYWKKSLAEMILGYAPKTENNTNKYLQFLRSKTGVKDNRKIKDFTPKEFEKLWRARRARSTRSGRLRKLENRFLELVLEHRLKFSWTILGSNVSGCQPHLAPAGLSYEP